MALTKEAATKAEYLENFVARRGHHHARPMFGIGLATNVFVGCCFSAAIHLAIAWLAAAVASASLDRPTKNDNICHVFPRILRALSTR